MTIDAKRLAIINKVLELNSEEIRILHAHVTKEKTDKEKVYDITFRLYNSLDEKWYVNSIREVRKSLSIPLIDARNLVCACRDNHGFV